MKKRCSRCQTEKNSGDFGRDSRRKDGKNPYCKECVRNAATQYRREQPDKRKESALKYVQNNPEKMAASRRAYKFRLTAEEVRAMVERQNGLCRICDDPLTGDMHVDHDPACCPARSARTCGRCVRGILCRRCNLALGMLQDDPDLLIKAAMYVTQHRNTLATLAGAPGVLPLINGG